MEKFTLKDCKTHGQTEFVLEGRGYYRCLKCRKFRVLERRRKVKQILVEEAGGKCIRCGYDTYIGALQFHHRNSKEKVRGLSQKGLTLGLNKLREEAKKCDLLCANCHCEVEEENRSSVDQLVDRLPVKETAVGSSPTVGAR